MNLPAALLIALLGAEVLAVVLAWRRRSSRPLLLLLAFALLDELAVLGLHAILAGAPRPIAGLWRVPYHIENALTLGWPAALAATAQGQPWRRLRAIVGAYLGMLAGLILLYPIDAPGSGSPRLRWILLAWEIACVALAWRGVWRARRRAWGAADVALVVLVSCETMVALVGPFASDPFTRWWIARAFYLAAWGAVIVLLARARRPA